MANVFLITVLTSFFALIVLWIYFFIYSYRHRDGFPWGFSLIFIGLLLTGAKYRIYDHQVEVFAIDFSLIVSLIGILWNVNNIRSQFHIRDKGEIIRLTGIGLVSGLLLGIFFILAQGTQHFQVDPRFTITTYIASSIQASISEELLFRGYLLSYLRTYKVNPIFSVIFQALMFAVLHIPRYPGNWVAIFIAFLAGLIAGYITWKINNLIPALILHIVFNLIVVAWWLAIA
jgi:membrane protease YdiL (CAAX protease family)